MQGTSNRYKEQVPAVVHLRHTVSVVVRLWSASVLCHQFHPLRFAFMWPLEASATSSATSRRQSDQTCTSPRGQQKLNNCARAKNWIQRLTGQDCTALTRWHFSDGTVQQDTDCCKKDLPYKVSTISTIQTPISLSTPIYRFGQDCHPISPISFCFHVTTWCVCRLLMT